MKPEDQYRYERKTTKNRTQLITVIVIVIAAIGFSLWRSGFNPFSSSKQWKWQYEKVVIGKGQDVNENPDIIQLGNGCYRLYSHGEGGSGGENLIQGIYSYYSCDGIDWEFEGRRIEKAAMPAAMITPDGQTRIYFQRGLENDQKQALVTAVSNDGLNFSGERQLLITGEGELKDVKAMAHFELVKLDKGYRIYFDDTDLVPADFEKYKNENWTWPVSRIRSIYSQDGLNWKLESGIRIEYEQEPLNLMQRATSCTVIKDGDKYHMYFNAGFSPWEDIKWWKRLRWSGIYEAVSADGLSWQIIDRSIFSTGSDPKIVRMGDKIRVFVSEGERGESNSIESYARTN